MFSKKTLTQKHVKSSYQNKPFECVNNSRQQQNHVTNKKVDMNQPN